MQPSNFDELTKALASSTSRRHALRTIVAASVGSFFGLGGIRSVFGANRDCAKWCKQVFGPNTPAASQCASDAAHHRGLCYQCPSATPASICCVRNTSGYCSGTSAARSPCDSAQCQTCDEQHGNCVSTCSSSETCCNGTCAQCCMDSDCTGQKCCSGTCSQCCADSDCPSGQTCVSGQCMCVTPSPPPTGPDQLGCLCNSGQVLLCMAAGCPNRAAVCADACLCHGGFNGGLAVCVFGNCT